MHHMLDNKGLQLCKFLLLFIKRQYFIDVATVASILFRHFFKLSLPLPYSSLSKFHINLYKKSSKKLSVCVFLTGYFLGMIHFLIFIFKRILLIKYSLDC